MVFPVAILLSIIVCKSDALEISSITESKDSTPQQISYFVKQKIEVDDPAVIRMIDLMLKCMYDEMRINPASKPLLDSSYTRLEDTLKLYNSELDDLLKNKVYEQKKNREILFQKWAKGKPEFENILTDFSKAYDSWRVYSKHYIYLTQFIAGSPLLTLAISLQPVENALVKQGGGNYKNAIEAANNARKKFLLKESQGYDRNFLAKAILIFYQDIPKNQHPIGFYEGIKGSFGDLKLENTYQKFMEAVFSNTMLFNEKKWNAFMEYPDATVLQEDPAFNLASTFLKNWQGKYLFYNLQFTQAKKEPERIYQKGLFLMDQKKIN